MPFAEHETNRHVRVLGVVVLHTENPLLARARIEYSSVEDTVPAEDAEQEKEQKGGTERK